MEPRQAQRIIRFFLMCFILTGICQGVVCAAQKAVVQGKPTVQKPKFSDGIKAVLNRILSVEFFPRQLGVLPWLERIRVGLTLPTGEEKLSGSVIAVTNSGPYSFLPEIVRPAGSMVTAKVSSSSKPEGSLTLTYPVGNNAKIMPTIGAENAVKTQKDTVTPQAGTKPQEILMAYVQAKGIVERGWWPSWMGRARPAVTMMNGKYGIAFGDKADHKGSVSACATWDEKTVGKGRPHIQVQASASKASGTSWQREVGVYAWFKGFFGNCLKPAEKDIEKTDPVLVSTLNGFSQKVGSWGPRIGVVHTFGNNSNAGDTALLIQLTSDGENAWTVINVDKKKVAAALSSLTLQPCDIEIDF